jgi:hypothetical protein
LFEKRKHWDVGTIFQVGLAVRFTTFIGHFLIIKKRRLFKKYIKQTSLLSSLTILLQKCAKTRKKGLLKN